MVARVALRVDSEKKLRSSDNLWRRQDLRVLLVPEDIPVVKEPVETTEWMVDPDFQVSQVLQVHQARLQLRLIWTRFPRSRLKETKLEEELPESDSCKHRWVLWDLAVPRDLPDPQERWDLSELVVILEIRDRSVNEDPPVQLDLPDLPEKRVNLAVTDNPDHRVFKDQWASVDRRACRVSREPKDTGVFLVQMAQRELRDNKVSPETSENPDPWVSPVQSAPVVPAVSVAVSDPQAPLVSVAATVFPAQEVLPVPLGLRVLPAFPANPDPKETKANKDLKAAPESKDPAERTVFPDLPENPEFKERPVWMVPTERKVPVVTWESKVLPASQDQEVLPVLLVTLAWLVPRVSRVNLVSQVFVV